MQNVFLVIHLILALSLISVVLLQRSEGGGLGIGGGMGPQSGRPPLTALAKVTWGLAAAFLVTSITLTILSARSSGDASVLDQWAGSSSSVTAPGLPELPLAPGAPLVPPRADAPTLPVAPEAPAVEAPAAETETTTETAPEASTPAETPAAPSAN